MNTEEYLTKLEDIKKEIEKKRNCEQFKKDYYHSTTFISGILLILMILFTTTVSLALNNISLLKILIPIITIPSSYLISSSIVYFIIMNSKQYKGINFKKLNNISLQALTDIEKEYLDILNINLDNKKETTRFTHIKNKENKIEPSKPKIKKL